jgi:molybdopterin-guanine dinucleotide biosynthesis protein A
VIVLACDLPAVTAPLVGLLLALADRGPDPYDVVVPRTGRGYHPLCAVYRRATCGPLAAAHLAAGTLAVRALFPRLQVREVSEAEVAAVGDPHRLLANINTPAEHAALAARIALKAHEP